MIEYIYIYIYICVWPLGNYNIKLQFPVQAPRTFPLEHIFGTGEYHQPLAVRDENSRGFFMDCSYFSCEFPAEVGPSQPNDRKKKEIPKIDQHVRLVKYL